MAFEHLMAEAQLKKEKKDDKKDEKKKEKSHLFSGAGKKPEDHNKSDEAGYKFDTNFKDEGWSRAKQQ